MEKDWQEGKKRNDYVFSERAHKQVLTVKKEHAPHFEQLHRSTCHSGHFHRARWRIPSREYELKRNLLTFLLIRCLGTPYGLGGQGADSDSEVPPRRWHQGGTTIPPASA